MSLTPDFQRTDKRPSEFGGRPGLIQRQEDGHTPTPAEKQMLLRQPDQSPFWVDGEMVVEDLPEGFDPGTRLV